MTQPRPLTHDEKKASEAAFLGLPFNPKWSQSARAVYDGIISTMEKPVIATTPVQELPDLNPATEQLLPVSSTTEPQEIEELSSEDIEVTSEQLIQRVRSRQEAIAAGYLMDVSEMAKRVGLDLAVGMTKPLWTHGICPSDDLSEQEQNSRVRDVLFAVRLRLAGMQAPAAFVEVPVLLPFPPEQTPQLFPIYALFHKDPIEDDSLLLIHPSEVSLAKQSFSGN